MTVKAREALLILGLRLPPAIERPLVGRRRTYALVRDTMPGPTVLLRGALVGPHTDAGLLGPAVARLVEESVPTILVGAAAASHSPSFDAGDADPVARMIQQTEAGQADPLSDGVMPGAVLVVEKDAPRPDQLVAGEALLTDTSGGIVLARSGHCYLTTIRLDATGSEGGGDSDQRFAPMHNAALVSRFLDAVVGRTDEETPWGRRGPEPVPGPGLALHPA